MPFNLTECIVSMATAYGTLENFEKQRFCNRLAGLQPLAIHIKFKNCVPFATNFPTMVDEHC